MTNSATEFLTLNGVQVNSVTINNCDSLPSLCVTQGVSQMRKLVQVHAVASVQLAFLPVIGINTVTISATAVSEAASLDVILVIDTSESMTYDAGQGDPMRDPAYCNTITSTPDRYGVIHTSSCEPFFDVTQAAIGFADSLFYPYDYAAVVNFDKEPNLDLSLCKDTDSNNHCIDGHTKAEIVDTLRRLTVFQGDSSYNHASSDTSDYRCYDFPNDQCAGPGADICTANPVMGSGSNYYGLIGRKQDPCLGYTPPYDPSHYTTTNIGGGLYLAGSELAHDQRQQALWVVILLTDGVANAGHSSTGNTYYCPQSTWSNVPRCNDLDVGSDVYDGGVDKCIPVSPPAYAARPADNSGNYDASDYAYAMADFVGKSYPTGQGALLYTIGLGPEVTNYTNYTPGSFKDPNSSPACATGEGLGTIFLNYAAAVGHGQSFYAATGADLDKIFQLIGGNIATRLSQ